ncbi:MAG: ion transporter [Flavobacteriales bacterium]|nr:ion transporter [Flavobacteriales bacterium]
MSYQSLKKRSYEILEQGSSSDKWSRIVDLFIITLILLNILAVILESVEWIKVHYEFIFSFFEILSICVFTVEYVFRLWSITEKEEYTHPIKGRLKYMFSFYGLIDLVALLPAYIPLLIKADLRVVRAIRILRLFRILKLTRYNKAFKHIKNVMKAAKEELIISLMAVLTLLVVASSLMYFIEHDVQPDAFPSIPATMWWGVATLTTVGYGDVYPVTDLGKLMAGVMAILGIGIFALPAGILANGFGSSIEKNKEDGEEACEHCGKKIKK